MKFMSRRCLQADRRAVDIFAADDEEFDMFTATPEKTRKVMDVFMNTAMIIITVFVVMNI